MTKKIDVAQMQADLGNFSSEYETIRHDDLMQVLSRLAQAEQAVARVRALLPDDADIREMFVVRAVDIRRALDGESNE